MNLNNIDLDTVNRVQFKKISNPPEQFLLLCLVFQLRIENFTYIIKKET